MEYYTKDHEHELKANSIASLRPEAQWSMMEGKLEWLDDKQTQPTESEIEAEGIRLEAEYDALQYQRDRQYPDLGEQLDMLFHDMTADKGSKTGEWYKAIAKVKADNPK